MAERPLKGRRALVTGASRGIGAATARGLVQAGAHVIRMARSAMPPLDDTTDLRVDLADRVARDAALAEAIAPGVPDIVINNAGAFLLAELHETSDALVREQFAINLEAPFAVARAMLPAMRGRGAGIHVTIGSVADWRAFPGNAAYAASKHAVRGFHEVLVEEFRGSGVRCALVSPGPVDTRVWDPFDPDHRADLPDRAAMLRPDDIAEIILFVVTRRAAVHLELVRVGPA